MPSTSRPRTKRPKTGRIGCLPHRAPTARKPTEEAVPSSGTFIWHGSCEPVPMRFLRRLPWLAFVLAVLPAEAARTSYKSRMYSSSPSSRGRGSISRVSRWSGQSRRISQRSVPAIPRPESRRRGWSMRRINSWPRASSRPTATFSRVRCAASKRMTATLYGWLAAINRINQYSTPEDMYWFCLHGSVDYLRNGITTALRFYVFRRSRRRPEFDRNGGKFGHSSARPGAL